MTKRRTMAAQLQATRQKPGRKSRIPDWLWNQLRDLWESTTDYTQTQLCDYARSKGHRMSQSLVCAKIANEGWIRGSKIEALRQEAEAAVADRFGEPVRQMLTRHVGQAQMGQSVALRHLQLGVIRQKDDPSYTMPIITVRTAISALRDAQDMEARALGFNYRDGRPFIYDDPDLDKNQEAAPSMTIREMTADDVAAVQAAAESEHLGGFGEGEEIVEPEGQPEVA